jgi:hypothetical protein
MDDPSLSEQAREAVLKAIIKSAPTHQVGTDRRQQPGRHP